MSSPFLGEIRMFGGNFPPRGWATCDGQLLAISQNTALFSLLGTFYGGDGKSTFALPNMAGNVPVHQGQGNGLSEYFIGEESGTSSVTLLVTEMPMHSHGVNAVSSAADQLSPANNFAAGGSLRGSNYFAAPNTGLGMFNVAYPAGGSQPHNNQQPYLALTFIIAMQGIFPARG